MIRIKLGHLLLDRDMKLKDLAERTGLAVNNLSILKTNKARAIRFSTLDLLCRELQCTPGELIEFVPGPDPDPDPDT
ncbi:MAG: helix-turn-helix transcriptional regulator [Sedimentisphaerales bacterium]|jgi:putative transcriptional regulator|nr:helix-turn-helix transcriptional regulator [Sedimentisphaerales bacterium]HNY78363.1 helix-turn-helix transcriptional regulator [Sedimentisphaerales bacterium]HOC63549.1 helix-turn-helix transcriptional regulator [Sedimentisphaerales bacterium]HOH62830.1 helix-turn-helix transcriptional regulator [Sedimentisphaerales bacterium]HPY51750.1 helix-turn-helix transcriptional regulator [Sedimentisphaerales bacterium]